MNVLFLDFDGVVNTPQWQKQEDGDITCRFNHSGDNAVNDFQAVQWVSEFCQQFKYSIVVTSTWRLCPNYGECLINGGLREDIEILGKTPYMSCGSRGDEITQWLAQHPEVDQYIILDDEADVGKHIKHLIICDFTIGFREREFYKAKKLHEYLIANNK